MKVTLDIPEEDYNFLGTMAKDPALCFEDVQNYLQALFEMAVIEAINWQAVTEVSYCPYCGEGCKKTPKTSDDTDIPF